MVLAYDNGETLKAVADFLKTINREDIFINAFITYGCMEVNDIERRLKYYLTELDTTYLDCLTLHGLDVIGFNLINYENKISELKKKGQFLNIGYSNLSPEQFKNMANEIDFFEGLYNLENKINEDTGILEKCQ